MFREKKSGIKGERPLIYTTKTSIMAMSIVNASEFSADIVSFSALRVNKARGNKTVYLSGPQRSKLNIQFPWMRVPFGLSSYTDAATNRTSFSLDVSFDKDHDALLDIKRRFEESDALVVKTVAANSKAWLGTSFHVAALKEAHYKPCSRARTQD